MRVVAARSCRPAAPAPPKGVPVEVHDERRHPRETYERILVPTDGSDHATAAARHVFGLAEPYGATVNALDQGDG